MKETRIKIGVIGTRGFPDIQGGIETHCLQLYTRIASLEENEITVYRRVPYLTDKNKNAYYRNIRFVDLFVPRNKYFETFLHSLFATVHSLFQGYDIVHFHNSGPGFFMPVLKFTRAKIVFTYHNISYTQKKWNKYARRFLSLSEKVSIIRSDFIIFISEIIKSEILERYKIKNYKIIPNGVIIPKKSLNWDYVKSLDLERGKYIISVGRFLEEKGFDYLIRAFRKADVKDYKLVIVGDTDYPTDYSDKLKTLARLNNIVLTGFIKGEELNQIFSFARLFVISSFAEGLPISLLEAMSYGLEILASDIPANLQIGLDSDDYFKTGNEDDLKEKMINKLSNLDGRNYNKILETNFNWNKIALDTIEVYKNILI